jgi:signal recognition particle subunit SRP54
MGLGEKLRDAVDKVKHSVHVDKDLVKEVIKEIQRALITSDVNIKLVLEISKDIEKNAFENIPSGITRKEHLVKTFYETLLKYMGGEEKELEENPKKILLCGLFGSGKTTTAAKLAKFYKKRGLKPGVICADTYRPAAYDQLKQLCERADVVFYGNPKEKKAFKVVEEGLAYLEKNNVNLTIVDSAGRSALDNELTKEIKEIYDVFKPEYSFLVLSADIGQAVKDQATAFNDTVGVQGVIITKLDGSAKGGGALTACYLTNSSIYFIGTGEKIEDIEQFNADRYLSRIMGYGDISSLLEKINEVTTQEQLEQMKDVDPKEILKGRFNFKLFKQQLEFTKKLGPFSKVLGFLGVGGKIPEEQKNLGQEKINKYNVILSSFTKEELNNDTDFITKSRILRISKGSGTKFEDVKEMISQVKKMKKMFRRMNGGDLKNLTKNINPKDFENMDASKMDLSQMKDLSKKLKYK